MMGAAVAVANMKKSRWSLYASVMIGAPLSRVLPSGLLYASIREPYPHSGSYDEVQFGR